MATDESLARDAVIRQAAFDHIRALQSRDLHDGPLLEQSLKAIAGGQIRLPRRREDRPDRDRLAARFEQFSAA